MIKKPKNVGTHPAKKAVIPLSSNSKLKAVIGFVNFSGFVWMFVFTTSNGVKIKWTEEEQSAPAAKKRRMISLVNFLSLSIGDRPLGPKSITVVK